MTKLGEFSLRDLPQKPQKREPKRAQHSTAATATLETPKMASWKKTITSPFRKACTFFNQSPSRDKKSHQEHEKRINMMNLQGEVMACAYEDVQVMWSILDKSKATTCD